MDLNELNQQSKFVVNMAGDSVEVDKSAQVAPTLKKMLEDRGLTSFALVIDGDEITNSDDIPETFADCDTVEVRRYTKAG